jgi:hypothetical protein
MTHHISLSLSPIAEPFHLTWRDGQILCHAAPTPRVWVWLPCLTVNCWALRPDPARVGVALDGDHADLAGSMPRMHAHLPHWVPSASASASSSGEDSRVTHTEGDTHNGREKEHMR